MAIVADAVREPWLRRAWRGEVGWTAAASLQVLARLYSGGLVIRSGLYATGMFRTRRLPCPVISVGNLTLGGSGKTPLAEVVARIVGELGGKPALLSRGYGRQTRGVQIVSDTDGIRLGARQGGDEPVLLAERLPGVPVVVGESRYEAGRVALERCGAGALVLDDGFQHRTLAKDLEIVSVAGRNPWGNGQLFPRGVLREPVEALRRADLIVVTNPPGPAAVSEVSATLGRLGARAAVLTASSEPEGARQVPDGRVEPPAALRGRRLLAFAGLAAPESFVATLSALGASVAGFVEFPDHHAFTRDDIEALTRRAGSASAEGLVTTEKDWVRLRETGRPGVPLWVLSIRMSVDRRDILVETLARVLQPSGARKPWP
jgi:tetraacyldisaccharide 4'-kinase